MDWELIVYLLVAGFALLPLLVRLPGASLAVKLSTVVVVIISLGPTLPSTSNALPGGSNSTSRAYPPYVGFLPVGFTLPRLLPNGR